MEYSQKRRDEHRMQDAETQDATQDARENQTGEMLLRLLLLLLLALLPWRITYM